MFNYQQMSQLMQFMNQMKNTNPNQQIQNLVSSGQVSNDMLTEARRRADAFCQACGIIKR